MVRVQLHPESVLLQHCLALLHDLLALFEQLPRGALQIAVLARLASSRIHHHHFFA
jgi:hypothetical protein